MSMPWGSGPARSRAPRPDARPASRPRLQVVPRVQRARGSHFVVLVTGMLVSGLIGLLLLNLSMQKGAFELAGLQDEIADLDTRKQALTLDLETLESTRHLARKARSLGMVPNTNPVFLDLTDGSVIGDPVPAAPRTTPPPDGDTTDDTADTVDDTADQEVVEDRTEDRAGQGEVVGAPAGDPGRGGRR